MDRSADDLGQVISGIQRDLEELKSSQGSGSGGGGGGGGGGEEYFAGDGIEIDQSNTISVDTSVVATQTDLASKQDTLTAGSHISISDNTISATGIPTKTSDLTNDSNFSSMEVVASLPATGSDDTLYFVEASDLPTGYERLSYINIPFKSPTTAYVALENIWTTTNWKMEFDFEVAQCYDYCAIFGRIDDADQDREIWINSSSIYRWRAFGYTGSSDNSFFGETVATNKRYVVSHDNLGASFVTTVNGNQTLSRAKLTGTATSSMNFAFGHREGGGQLYGKIYGYKAWDGNGIVENLVPAKRTSDDALGFYDMANGTFKAMQGSGVSQLTGGDYNSYGYDTYIWDGSAYQQVGERVYLTSQLVNDSGFLTSVSWNDVQNKPNFATVATTGDYDDLTNKPTIDSAMSESSTNAVQNKVISSKVNQIDRFYRSLVPFGTAIETQDTDLNTLDYIKVGKYYCSLDSVARTLVNCPTTNAFMMEVFSPLSTTVDNETTSSYVYRLRILTTYLGKMYVQRVNSGATAGTFTYFDWRPIAEGTINNGTLTIQRNGTNVATFTANQSTTTTANIETKELVTNLDARASFLPSTVAQQNKSMTVFTTMNALDSQTQGGGFADALVLSTWNDASGGRINTLVATKNGTNPELYHYTGSYNGSSWSAKKKIAYTTDLPTVNNGTLTVTQNGATAGTFTANQSGNATIALTDTTYSDMTGATSSTAGTGGLVPEPAAGDQDKFLRGDGTWTSVTPGGGEDTGWVDLRPYMVSTNVYEARPGNYYPKARRINGIVYLSGEIYCKLSVGVMTSTLLENIPEMFVPDTPEGQANGSGVCYELSNSYYMIFIETMANGKGRIRISQPYTKIPSTGNYQGYSLSGISPYPGK